MNYRHAFHAGNFADVHKHAVLARILWHLREKATAFRVVDTHAGAGRYDLSGEEANRTGEWRDGIGRLRAATLRPDIRALLAPYLDALGHAASEPSAHIYPGSPALALALMRPQDRLVACEAEPEAAGRLATLLAKDRRAKAIAIDGWTGLIANIPPKERRGLVLIDPPFEQPDEFSHAAEQLAAAHRKWPTGLFMLWYPIKDRSEPDRLAERLRDAVIPKLLRAELSVAPAGPERLSGSGLVIVNPPWRLPDELNLLQPALATLLAREGAGKPRVEWLRGER